jgi:hypothetical protein
MLKTDYLKQLPWPSIEAFQKELESIWEDMKQQGLDKNILTQREDGAIIGKGHPDKWFDAVDTEGK